MPKARFYQADLIELLRAHARRLSLPTQVAGSLYSGPLEGESEAVFSPLRQLLEAAKRNGCDELFLEADYQPDRNWYDMQLMFRFECRRGAAPVLWRQAPWFAAIQGGFARNGWRAESPFSATPQTLFCALLCSVWEE